MGRGVHRFMTQRLIVILDCIERCALQRGRFRTGPFHGNQFMHSLSKVYILCVWLPKRIKHETGINLTERLILLFPVMNELPSWRRPKATPLLLVLCTQLYSAKDDKAVGLSLTAPSTLVLPVVVHSLLYYAKPGADSGHFNIKIPTKQKALTIWLNTMPSCTMASISMDHHPPFSIPHSPAKSGSNDTVLIIMCTGFYCQLLITIKFI